MLLCVSVFVCHIKVGLARSETLTSPFHLHQSAWQRFNAKHVMVRVTHTQTYHWSEGPWQEEEVGLVFMSWYLKSYLWHHRETTYCLNAEFTAPLWACGTLTFLHNLKILDFTHIIRADTKLTLLIHYTHTHRLTKCSDPAGLSLYVAWPPYQAFPVTLMSAHCTLMDSPMYPYITALQCLCKALLLILCCFNLPGRPSLSPPCCGSPWVMRRSC